MRNILSLLSFMLIISQLSAQNKIISSGPMTAYSTMTEVAVWVQTVEKAKLQLEYWKADSTEHRVFSDFRYANKKNDFIINFVITDLDPGTIYHYQLHVNGEKIISDFRQSFQTQELWQWRHDAPDFSFVTGSCAYINEPVHDRPGIPYGSHYEIFLDIYNRKPDFMLWLGDNTYLREVDWSSRSGILHRYSHSRALPEMQPMLGSMHHYAIWDDHDYGPDNSDRSYSMKEITNETFRKFYPSPNHIFNKGTTSFFQWSDCDFFLLDNRYNRTPDLRTDIEHHEILGKKQMEWLLDALVNSKASFKFIVIGNPFLNETPSKENYINFAPKERKQLLKAIAELKIEGVLFLTGDIHYTEMTVIQRTDAYPLYDITISPLTSGLGSYSEDDNHQRMEGTLVREHNYAHISVSGKRSDRRLQIQVYNSSGELKWTRVVEANKLRYK